MSKRPIAWLGLLIMLAAVVIGFVPNIFGILLLFVTTLFGGYQIKKQTDQETYDYFIRKFAHVVIVFNLVFVGMVMLTPLEPVDKISAAFLNMMVVFVMMTFLKLHDKHKE